MDKRRKETPQERWQKSHVKRYGIAVMLDTERDIIQRLDSVPNKAGYIKQLIRDDINKLQS